MCPLGTGWTRPTASPAIGMRGQLSVPKWRLGWRLRLQGGGCSAGRVYLRGARSAPGPLVTGEARRPRSVQCSPSTGHAASWASLHGSRQPPHFSEADAKAQRGAVTVYRGGAGSLPLSPSSASMCPHRSPNGMFALWKGLVKTTLAAFSSFLFPFSRNRCFCLELKNGSQRWGASSKPRGQAPKVEGAE